MVGVTVIVGVKVIVGVTVGVLVGVTEIVGVIVGVDVTEIDLKASTQGAIQSLILKFGIISVM